MGEMTSKKRAAGIAVLGLVAGGGLSYTAGLAWASSSSDDTAKQAVSETAAESDGATDAPGGYALRDFPTNSRGLTYGSDAAVATAADAPDLVAVVGDNGSPGFVYAEELYRDGAAVRTPADALAYEKRLAASGPAALTVYDVEGVEVVDTFTPVLGDVSHAPDEDETAR